ncbi:MAG: carbamoyltransferase C-terminal domain-containing protein [Candidatus Moraniibacteriota bacterium]
MNDLKFSILIPTYKGAGIIGETLRSILSQSFTNYEIIIQEDASGDNIEEVIREFNDPRIKFFRNAKNLSYAVNMEAGRKNCTGDILYLMGQDDILGTDALLNTYNAFKSSDDVGAVTRPYYWFDKEITVPVRAKKQLNPEEDEIIKITDKYSRILDVFKTLDQLSGLAYRVKYMDRGFHPDCFPCHIYPFASIFKKHPVVFLKDYNIAVRISSSQTRSISSIYDKSPMQSWVEMFETVFSENKFRQLERYCVRNFVAVNYVGLVQLRNFAKYRYLLREIYYLVRYRWDNLLSLQFWFFSLGCAIAPPFLLIPMVDWWKSKIYSKKLKHIKFDYQLSNIKINETNHMKGVKTLGITAPISENSAACIMVDGKLISFVEEERFNGIKHAPRMIPKRAIAYCLNEANIKLSDIDYIAVGFDSVFKSWGKNIISNLVEGNFGRLIRENGAYLEYFLNMIKLNDFLLTLDESGSFKKKFRYVPHHIAHAASAARFSGFSESIVITLDGVGEDNAGLQGYFKNNKISVYKYIGINQSLGWLYSTVTKICGFKPHSHEGKVMGLAAYGKADIEMLSGIATLTRDGYVLEKNWTSKIEKKIPEREKKDELNDVYKNLAATTQFFLEEAVIRLAKSLFQKTKIKNICLAGGVALNCDTNAKLIELDIFENIYIQPAANDAGTALGAAAEVYANETSNMCEELKHAYYGPSYGEEEIETLFKESKIAYRKIIGVSEIAKMIHEGKIIGWFNGRMEFGPRALGNRSIIASPLIPEMKDKINSEVKHREGWRPFSPSVLKEYTGEYFENYHHSPFMLLTFKTKSEKADRLRAAIHVDDTARVQEVSQETNPRYHELISEFYKLSGVPAVLNTSFNDRDKPICLTPRDALQTFYSTGIDVLVVENFVVEK